MKLSNLRTWRKAGEISSPAIFNMLDAYFFRMDKRINSTRRPADEGGVRIPVEIIDDCSIENPLFRIMGNPLQTDFVGRFNYIHFSAFGSRYYWIEEAVYCSDDGFWHLRCSVDPLASAKDDILNTLQFVERSASSWDLTIIDKAYPTDSEPQYFNRKYAEFFNATPSNGLYIIGMVAGSGGSRFGAIQYWLLTHSQLGALVTYMMGVRNYADASVTGIAADLLGFIGEPLQFIVSCKFLPRTIIDISSMTAEQIYFGAYEAVGCLGYKLPISFINPAPVIHDGFTMPLDDHPQVVTRGKWLNSNGYTQRVLRFEPFGTIPLDSSRLVGYEYIALDIATDIITGQSILSVYASHTAWAQIEDVASLPLIGCYPASLLIDIPLSQYTHKGLLDTVIKNGVLPATYGMVTSGVSGFMSGGYSGMAMGIGQGGMNMIMSVDDGARNYFSPPSSQGSPGSLLCRTQVILSNKFSLLVEEDLSEWGRPLCKLRSLSNLSGFTKCRGATFSSSNWTKPECQKIEQFLNSGFFIE